MQSFLLSRQQTNSERANSKVVSSCASVRLMMLISCRPEVGKLIKESTLENMLKQDKQLASQFRDMNQFKFTIIEEKRKEHSGSKLEKWEAQVVGEALAMCVTRFESLRNLDHSQPTLDSMSENEVFFLDPCDLFSSHMHSTGEILCLGALATEKNGCLAFLPRGPQREPWKVFRLPILSLREGSRGSDLEILFKLLIIWVSTNQITCLESLKNPCVAQTAIPDRLIMRVFFTPAAEIGRYDI
jgi:hypothetical protein